MKKFLMYVIVLVVFLFVGYTTYYFIRNNEVIELTLADEEVIYINSGESFDMPIAWTKPYGSTTVYEDENVDISNEDVIKYHSETKKFTARVGGVATITITPSNADFGPFIFDVHVGDGTLLNPYYVRSADDIQKIGKPDSGWLLSESYILTKDIDLSLYNNGIWTPVGTETQHFVGTFNGNGKVISKLKVTSGTCAGLFSAIGSSGRVENVVIKDATLQGSFKYAGAIAGYSCGKIGKCNAENVTIANTLADSMNGGIVGFVSYQKSKDVFANYGSVEMCSATISSTAAGTVGGIAGKAEATFIYNCKATINSLTQGESSVAFGGVVGEIASVTSGENFYLSILKNCYALLNNVTFAEKTNGGLVGNNADNGETYNNIFRNNYFTSTTDIAGVGATTKEVAVADKKSYAELQQKATYVNWDFENAWTISEGLSTAEINFKGDYSAINEYIPGSEINSLDALKTIIESIRKNPEISKNYEITGNIEYDLGGAEWETIAPNQDQPLASSILCEEGVTVTIKNFKISGDNSSFFGYVAGENTKISGLVFKDVIMDTTAPVVGIVSTILTNATIENCAVENASIKTSDTCLNVGYVAGINLGTINNCSVNKNTAEANNLESASLNVKMGGIAGTNMSKITNSSIDLISFLPTDAIDSFAEIGGIAGRNEKTLQNCYNYSATLQTSFNGQLFAGGVAGVNANGGTISSCLSTAKIDINMSNDKVYVGGITGYNNADCLVEKSYFAKEEIKASQVAGIALVNKGKIDQCLFQGSLVGKNASGLAKTNYSTISNCSILGSVNGFNSSSVTSGYVYSLEVGCMVKHCFSNMSFGDTGKHYAESASDFRVVVEKVLQIFNQYPDTGDLRYCVTIGYGSAEVKSGFFGLITNDNQFITCSSDEAKGLKGDYSVFKNTAGFEQAYWTFQSGEEGAYPTLSNLVVDPRA